MGFFSALAQFFKCFFFGVYSTQIGDYGFGEDEKKFSGFSKYFDENIRPKGLLLEEIRIKNLKRFITRFRLVALVMSLMWIGIFYLKTHGYIYGETKENFIGYAIAISFVIFFWPFMVIGEFGLEIKKNLFTDIFKFCNFNYYAKGSKMIADYECFGIIPTYDVGLSSTEDLVIGSYKNVNFRLEELALRIERYSGKRRRIVTTFRGAVIMMKFNKNFEGRTIVKSDIGMIGNFSRKLTAGDLSALERVELEDPDFEKTFEVYSSNQIEARYLLTTSFMERLKKLGNFFGANKIEASFYSNALLLTFSHSMNLFEVDSIFESINVAVESRKILEEIALIFDVIETLKLDERTGL